MSMDDTRIILSGLWGATVLTYLYGDVLRIMSGDAERMMTEQAQFSQVMWLGMAILMAIPIVMVFLSLALPRRVNRWANIIMAVFWFGFNLVGLPTYPSAYDQFLLALSMGFNALAVWYAWKWSEKKEGA
jgi:hypothetical protein